MRPSIAIIFMGLAAPLAALALPHPVQNDIGVSQDLSIRQNRNGGGRGGPQNGGRPQAPPAPQPPRGGPQPPRGGPVRPQPGRPPVRPQPGRPPVNGAPTPVPTTVPTDGAPVEALPTTLPDVEAPVEATPIEGPPVEAKPTTLPDVGAPVEAVPEEGSCDISGLSLPENAQGLPPPSTGLELVLIALGTGTQNYTCADPTAKPVANGAIATLTKANCAVSGGGADDAGVIGNHFFPDKTTAEFDVAELGNTQLKKAADTPAPSPATNVPFLKLQAQAQGSTSSVKEIYRLETKGGVPPADCAGQAPGSTVTVNYTAQYWFFA